MPGVETQKSDEAGMLERLQELHRAAEQRLRELGRHVWLSPDEQVELARIKKEKLHLKDRMRNLVNRP